MGLLQGDDANPWTLKDGDTQKCTMIAKIMNFLTTHLALFSQLDLSAGFLEKIKSIITLSDNKALGPVASILEWTRKLPVPGHDSP